MAVTITPSANSALSSELLLSGTLLIENAKDDGTETLAVSVYNKNTGATFTGTAQVYDTSKTTLTYTYANGTNFSVNLGTGNWVYQRLSTEVGNTVYTYIITFVWADSDGNISKTLTIETRENVVVNSFVANHLDDLDETITGVCDIDIVNTTGINISANVTVNNNAMAGPAQSLSTPTDTINWTFVDGTELTVNLHDKTFLYTRAANNIGDNSVDSYTIVISISAVNASLSVLSTVGFPPSIKGFSLNQAVDTDLEITGTVSITNAYNANISANVTVNGTLYKGETKTYSESISWEYSNGAKLLIENNSIRYIRATSETKDLNTDAYIIELLISNKYGTDSVQDKIQTAIPKATIVAFAADNVSDTEKKINGVLKFEMPVIANNPTIKIDVAVNGVVYQGTNSVLSGASISYEYANGSSFVLDVANNSFVYTRASDDYTNADADVYTFDCLISVNGENVSQSLTVKSLAGQRFYDYEPACPVSIQPGSVETQRTAWGKYVEENKRLYRLLNENLNYYENIALQLKSELEKFKAYMASLSFMPRGTILIWDRDVADIPEGWVLCDGRNNAAPNLINRFLKGATQAGKYGQAGLPNITGSFNLSGVDWSAWANGAFYLSSGWQYEHPSGKGTTNSTINFSASRINPIFGRSNTVEPDSYSVCFIKKVSD